MERFKTRSELAEMALTVLKASSAPVQLRPEQEELARDLTSRHGNLRVTRESHGLHFYLACPNCLKLEGEDELWKMHLAVNVDKYFDGQTGAASCMKTGESFKVDELTMWPALLERGYDRGPGKVIEPSINTDFLEVDDRGRMIPKSPGETTPLRDLPPDHPAIVYLNSRQFDARSLERQFNASYCYQERKEIRYRKLLGGFRATPQGRIVFEIRQHGVRVGWQARILEMEDERFCYYLHPYSDQWVAVKQRDTPESDWYPIEGWEDWDPAKYIMSHGAKRNECLMGYDAARAYNAAHPGKPKWAMVLEGPLDAGRLGSPAIATCGKYCSKEQTDLLVEAFDVIIAVQDNDQYGGKLPEHLGAWLAGRKPFFSIRPPAHRKDAGLLTAQEVKMFRMGAMSKAALL